MNTPQAGSGTPEQLVESLSALRNLGCEYVVICYFPEAALRPPGYRELFEREVIPGAGLTKSVDASGARAWPILTSMQLERGGTTAQTFSRVKHNCLRFRAEISL